MADGNKEDIVNNVEVAVIIPCMDEAASKEAVIQEFERSLPKAKIYVCANNSNYQAVALAQAAGAIVRRESLQG